MIIFFRIIASGVRRLSRSFYGGSGENLHTQRRTGSFAELSGSHGSLRQSPTTHHSQVRNDLIHDREN